MKRTIKPNEILSTKDVADILKVSPRTVSRSVKRGELPRGKMIGQKRVWLGSDILSSMASLPEIDTTKIPQLTDEEE